MKTTRKIIVLLILTLGLVYSCRSIDTLSKDQIIANIDVKLQTQDYTFVATRANPSGGSSINLTSLYYLKVNSDSIIAYLPYYGRAYSAPFPSSEGGIKFTSTNFIYSASEKEKGMYKVSIEVRDSAEKYKLSLHIGETGFGTLNVMQNSKQAITFYGNIE